MLAAGRYEAHAVPGEFAFAENKNGNTYVTVLMQVISEPGKGEKITYRGFLTEKAAERTLADLKVMGWDGVSLETQDGLGTGLVSITVEHETNNGKTYANVRWVNPPGKRGMVKEALAPEKLRELAIRFGAAGKPKSDVPF